MSCGSRFKRPTSRWFTLWFSNVEQDVPPSEKIEKILYYSVVLCYVIYFLIRLRFPELQVVVTWTRFFSLFIWHNVNAFWKVFLLSAASFFHGQSPLLMMSQRSNEMRHHPAQGSFSIATTHTISPHKKRKLTVKIKKTTNARNFGILWGGSKRENPY